MGLDEFLRHFVLAAAAADRRWLRAREAEDVLRGIAVWEGLTQAAGLQESGPAELVEARLAASTLYVRRFEAGADADDLSAALALLDAARARIAHGSFADHQARMAHAACLLLRFQERGAAEDLDRAIQIWTSLLATEAGAPAAANLGRALLARHRLSGDEGDLHDGRLLLDHASAELPADHPARRDVELALRSVR